MSIMIGTATIRTIGRRVEYVDNHQKYQLRSGIAERLCTGAGDFRPVDPEVTSVAIQGLRSSVPCKGCRQQLRGMEQGLVFNAWSSRSLAASARHAGHQQQQARGNTVRVDRSCRATTLVCPRMTWRGQVLRQHQRLVGARAGGRRTRGFMFNGRTVPGSASRCGLHSEDGCP